MIKTMADKVLIVGAGMTGASVAACLREDFHKGVQICVWDKARGTGGRMSTSRSSADSRCTVDLGAQYISATPDYQAKHAQYYRELQTTGILQPLQGTIDGHQDRETGTQHYVAPGGISTLVKHFLNKADASMSRETLVKNVTVTSNGKVSVVSESQVTEEFDGVVLTMPVPQILQLEGSIQDLIKENNVRGPLEDVSYSARFAVGLFYPPGTKLDYPWSARYITNNPCIRFVAIDDRKRKAEQEGVGPALCVHTGAPWGLENLERDKESAKVDILQQLKQVLPDLPEPAEVKGHKWRYSQVHRGYSGSPGCVVLSEDPLVILAGDAFKHSNFDGCLDSALAVRDVFKKVFAAKVKL